MRFSVWMTAMALLVPVAARARFDLPLKACHRGIMSEAQENTEPAIRAAIGRADILDLDVMVTQHGDIVCAHDEKLNELDPNLDGRSLRSLGREEIRKIRIGTHIPYTRAGRQMDQQYRSETGFAFLDEVFDPYIHQIIFWLDIKNRAYSPLSRDRDVEVLDEFLKSRQSVLDRVIISSTNPFIVAALADRAGKHGYLHKLTLGFDYGDDPFSRFAFEGAKSGIQYGFNFMAVARENLVDGQGSPAGGQALIDELLRRNPGLKVLVYSYVPMQTPAFKHIYSYMIEYLQQHPAP